MIIAFFVAILMSFLQMLKEQTTFEEKTIKNHGTFPSLTICESQDNINLDTKYKTFEDVMTAIEESKLNVFASILYRHNTFDLKNYSSLRGKFETTYEKVWSHSATIFQDEYATIIICTTLNLDFITKPDHLGSVWLNLTILTERPIYVEKHMPWQSLHNYQFNWVDGFDILYTNKAYTQIPIPIETISLKTNSHDCNQDNSLRFTQCINEFMAEEMNCTVPWITKSSSSSRPKTCSGQAKLEEFRRFYRDISTNRTTAKIDKKGCFVPNCRQISWKKAYVDSFDRFKSNKDENGTLLWFGLPSNTFTIRRQEILLADFSTFVADCGSYLGLFLGASVLSITDILVSFAKKLIQRIFRKSVSLGIRVHHQDQDVQTDCTIIY